MRRLFFILFFITIVAGASLDAAGFTMRDLRVQERKATLHAFKKLHLHRLNYRHKLYKKAKRKRLKKLSHTFMPTISEHKYFKESMNSEIEHNANIKVTANENMDIVIQTGGNIELYKEYKDKNELAQEMNSINEAIQGNDTVLNNRPEIAKPTESDSSAGNQNSIEKKPVTNNELLVEPITSDTAVTNDTSISSTTATESSTPIESSTTETIATTDTSSDTSVNNIRARYINPWARKR